jgi:hypothetical protein
MPTAVVATSSTTGEVLDVGGAWIDDGDGIGSSDASKRCRKRDLAAANTKTSSVLDVGGARRPPRSRCLVAPGASPAPPTTLASALVRCFPGFTDLREAA